MTAVYNHDHENEITLFAETNYRNQRRRFGIKTDDRRRHLYIIGKTGMGKTVLQKNMVMSDVMAGHGVCYVDPHGDTAEEILDLIPSNRINDVIYFNPADMEFPMGFNILESVSDNQKHLIASGLMGVFKKIWPDVWSPRMEYILLNCVLALLDYPGATLLGINRLLVDEEYRKRVIAKIRDPIVKTFWVAEFSSWSEKYQTEAIAPIQNKVGQFLSASIVRNIVSQVQSTIDVRKIMDEGKIFIVNLSKGRIGEENMRLLGGMLISRLQMAAMERVDIPEADRRDFYLFVDEFQNFANESFASILSEARKYRLSLTVAHQYVEQLTDEVKAAVIGNVGTMIAFRVGSTDAEFLEKEFSPTFTAEDLVNLPKYNVYLKLMVDGVATTPFSATTLPSLAQVTNNSQKVIQVSRERYAMPRATIAEKVLRWSGMETSSLRGADTIAEEESDARIASLRHNQGGVDAPTDESDTSINISEAVKWPATKLPDEYDEEGNDEEYLKISSERMQSFKKPQAGGAKKNKPMFSHTCSRCGKIWEMPVKLDPSRPMYCSDCLPLIKTEQKEKEKIFKKGPGDDAAAEARSVKAPRFDKPDKKPDWNPSKKPVEKPINKPRIIGEIKLPDGTEVKGEPVTMDNSDEKEAGSEQKQSIPVKNQNSVNPRGLLEELESLKGKSFETRKSKVEKRIDQPAYKPASRSQNMPTRSIATDSVPKQPVKDDVKLAVAEPRPIKAPTLTVFKNNPNTLNPGQKVTF